LVKYQVPLASPPADDVRRAITATQRLAGLLAERRSQIAREVGLSEGQWRVLEEIAEPGFLPSLFARRTETRPAAVSRLLRQLQDRRLVVASIAASDARQRRYELTPAGRELLARIEASRDAAVRAVWSALDPEALGRFAALAEEISTRLERYAATRR
jgi:DNA-binding MarR family transcriptional regulator